ncbi:MAG TPA: hypothetical protein VK142_10950 [Bacillota bacterium]|nr:hypothetical protein [Bacillota bacterium]
MYVVRHSLSKGNKTRVCREGFIELQLGLESPVVLPEVKFVLTNVNRVQVLFEKDHYGIIYAVNEEGCVGYQYESYTFNCKLEVNE